MQKDGEDTDSDTSSVEGAVGGHDLDEEDEDEGYYLEEGFDDVMFGEDVDLKDK